MNQDRPNGDLEVGTFFRITAWVGEYEYLESSAVSTPFGLVLRNSTTHDGDETDDDNVVKQKNRTFFTDVMEVLAIDFPHIIARCYSISGGHRRLFTLDMRAFESTTKIDPTYKKVLMEYMEK